MLTWTAVQQVGPATMEITPDINDYLPQYHLPFLISISRHSVGCLLESESDSELRRGLGGTRERAPQSLTTGEASSSPTVREMDDYTREMMDLKTLITRTLEKKGVLAKIRAELRASVFEAIEEEDRVVESEDLPPALLGSCNERARQLHASPSGRLLTALVCEYLDWAQLNHTLKVYQPECNLQKDSWKSELKEFSSKNGYDLNKNGDGAPLLLDVLEGFLKYENLSKGRSTVRRMATPEEPLSSLESRNARRPSSSSVAGGLPPLGRSVPASHTSDRRAGSSMSGYQKDDYNWRYDKDELPEDIIRASTALENLQLDRKARNLTTSWWHAGDGTSEDERMDA